MTALNEGHLKEASDNGPIERRDVASCRRSETGSSLTGPQFPTCFAGGYILRRPNNCAILASSGLR